MKLRSWLTESGTTAREFGRVIDASARAVGRYMLPPVHADCRIPDRRRMAAIWLATGGRVAPNDFYELPALPRAVPETRAAAE